MSLPLPRLELAVVTACGRFLHWWFRHKARSLVAALLFLKLTLVSYHSFKEIRCICSRSKGLPLFSLATSSRARLNFCLPSQEPCAIFTDFTVSAAFLLSASGLELSLPCDYCKGFSQPSFLLFFTLIFLEGSLLWFHCLGLTQTQFCVFCHNWTLPSSSMEGAENKNCLGWPGLKLYKRGITYNSVNGLWMGNTNWVAFNVAKVGIVFDTYKQKSMMSKIHSKLGVCWLFQLWAKKIAQTTTKKHPTT